MEIKIDDEHICPQHSKCPLYKNSHCIDKMIGIVLSLVKPAYDLDKNHPIITNEDVLKEVFGTSNFDTILGCPQAYIVPKYIVDDIDQLQNFIEHEYGEIIPGELLKNPYIEIKYEPQDSLYKVTINREKWLKAEYKPPIFCDVTINREKRLASESTSSKRKENPKTAYKYESSLYAMKSAVEYDILKSYQFAIDQTYYDHKVAHIFHCLLAGLYDKGYFEDLETGEEWEDYCDRYIKRFEKFLKRYEKIMDKNE